jgi:hypothetical protein
MNLSTKIYPLAFVVYYTSGWAHLLVFDISFFLLFGMLFILSIYIAVMVREISKSLGGIGGVSTKTDDGRTEPRSIMGFVFTQY